MTKRLDPAINAISAIGDRMRSSWSDPAKPSPYSLRMSLEVRAIHEAVRGLDAIQKNRSQTETDGAHFLRVSKAAQQAKARFDASVNRLNETLQESARDLDGRIVQRLGLVENQYSAEIRATLRAMPDDKRNAYVREAIDRKDGAFVAAVVNAPSILTGVSDEMKGRYKELLTEKVAPELVAEQSEIFETFSAAMAAVTAAKRAASEVSDPALQISIEISQMRAEEAQRHFDATISGLVTG